MKIAIIGGVAAGTSAAAKARRENKDAEIILFEKGNNISYAGCGLPYYICDIVPKRENIIINTPQKFAEKYKVNVKIGHEVTEIVPNSRTIKYKNLHNNNKEKYRYDKLIIATGAKPIFPPIPGSDLDNVVTLRTVKDADNIKSILTNQGIGQAVIIGGGLIGLEMAESFHEIGLKVTVVEKAPQLLPPFSKKMAGIVRKHLNDKGVRVIVNDGVSEIQGKEKVEQVLTESGQIIKAGLVLVSIGIRPDTKLAENAGIELGIADAIKINQKMETSIANIYAAGDCCESRNILTGENVWIPLGSTANKQGRTAGGNAAGGNFCHKGILKTGITKIFDLSVARTGLTVDEARDNGYKAETVQIAAGNHAGYYPGREKLNMLGVYDTNTGQILGAEIVGGSGTDKRIDVLSTAIYSKLTVEDLFQLDLAYAPPYSSPKDPVAIMGMVMNK